MHRLTLPELQDAAKRYNAYFDALKACFVGRDHIIDVLRFAMAQRQHVLIFGPPGTAKTALCDVAFSGITGAEKFRAELSMYMGEDALFGPYDTKRMREDGVLEHRVEGMLPQAHLARIGEFLDGSMPTLRALLGALNEREMRRGRQILQLPLLTVYCDTNKNPAEVLKKDPYLWAVLDRILFISNLGFLESEDDMTEMLRRFQSGRTAKVKETLPLELINSLTEPVVCPPSLITDQLVYIKLGQAFVEYREQRQQAIKSNSIPDAVLPMISDRRFALASQMLEVAAVLNGRFQIEPQDMELCYHVLGTTAQEKQLWLDICRVKIQEIEAEKSQQLDHSQVVAIEAIIQQAELINGDDLPLAGDTIRTLEHQLEGIIPAEQAVEERKQQAARKLVEIRSALRAKVLAAHNLG